MEEWKIAERRRQSADCVVWLKTACWSSLPWCFEDRWRQGWLKTAAGNYFVPRPLLIFSEMIYKLTAVCRLLDMFLFGWTEHCHVQDICLITNKKVNYENKLICCAQIMQSVANIASQLPSTTYTSTSGSSSQATWRILPKSSMTPLCETSAEAKLWHKCFKAYNTDWSVINQQE